MKVILIRHGKTHGNILKRYIGTTDEPLEDKFIYRQYPDVNIVITSPLKRCVQTAELIYPSVDKVICKDLRETNFGDFENKSYEDLKNNERYLKWLGSNGKLPFPNGESHADFVSRCVSAYKNVIKTYKGKNIAFVIHGGTIMAIMQYIFGGDFYDYQVKNLEGYEVYLNGSNLGTTKNTLDYYKKI